MKAKLFGLALLMLLAPVLACAGTTCAVATVLAADGRKLDFDFVAASGDNFYQFTGFAGRSYSVEVHQDYDDQNNVFPGGVTIGTGCPVSALAGTTDTSTTEPVLSINAVRKSFVTGAAPASQVYTIDVHNSDTVNGHYIAVTVADTTAFNSAWSTFGGNVTDFTFQNTTSQTIVGTLTITDTQGSPKAVIAPLQFNIPPNTVADKIAGPASCSCADLVTPAGGHGGFAVFTNNGPPGAVAVGAFFVSLVNGAIVPAPFTPVRDKR